MKKALALLLALVLCLSIAACGADPSSTSGASTSGSGSVSASGSEDVTQEPVKITIYPRDANLTSGVVGGWRGDWILENYGLIIEVWAYSDEKTNAILASGDLPDIMYISDANRETMIQGNMLLNLDDHLANIPHVAENEDIQRALGYVREYKSADTGSVYCLPQAVGDAMPRTETERYGMYLNWELYDALGCPEFNSLEELIPVLKQMQQATPVSDDGTNMYAMHLYSGGDTTYFGNVLSIMSLFGYSADNLAYLIETDMVNAEYASILEDDSLYRYGIEYMNKLYREGLLDPDSINYDRATTQSMIAAKNALASWAATPGWQNGGFFQYYFEGEHIYFNPTSMYGSNTFIGINANTQNVEACLRLLDMFADPNATLVLRFGPEGEMWYTDDNGDSWAADEIAEDGNCDGFVYSNGEEYALFNTGYLINSGALTDLTQNGEALCHILTSWPDVVTQSSQSDLRSKWQAFIGHETWRELLLEKNAWASDSELAFVTTFTTQPTSAQQLIIDALKDTVVNASWKMVYAETDAVFEGIWAQMVQDCADLGAQDIIDWRLDDLATAKQAKDSIGN